MSTAYSDYLDFYRNGPFAPFLVEKRVAGATPVRMIKAAQPAGDVSDPATPDLVLTLANGRPYRLTVDVGAGRWRGRFGPGTLGLQPAGASASIVIDDPHEILLIAMPFNLLRSSIEEACPGFGDFGRLHAAPFRDPFVEALCRRMWDEAVDGNPLGSLFADAAVQTLALALLRSSHQAPAGPESIRGGLAPYRLRRVLDCIEARLAEDLSLDDLAAAAALSPLYFARAFRQATGQAPHQYVVHRRVERAKELLGGTDLPIAEIALACGFCSQQHLARWFKRMVGVTPKEWRDGT